MALFEPVQVLALVGAPVRPSEDPPALHSASHPLALVGAAVFPVVSASSMEDIVTELALIEPLLAPRVVALPSHLPLAELASVPQAVRPHLCSVTMLLAAVPLALVARAIWEGECTLPVRVACPVLADVHAAVGLVVLPRALELVLLPLSVVNRPILAKLNAIAMAALAEPLARVGGTVRKDKGRAPRLLGARWLGGSGIVQVVGELPERRHVIQQLLLQPGI
mmetsp:Transcript_59600/g.174347  ORF Transcript_59600/g.174347 Transcript_59600/m.174347 type:complete len:223 (+) Transcript_59600:417-1085(+)